jgi:hypothetical protein
MRNFLTNANNRKRAAVLALLAAMGTAGCGSDGSVAEEPDAESNDAGAEREAELADASADAPESSETEDDAATETDADDASDAADDQPFSGCPILQATGVAGAARSQGYSGTEAAYIALYGTPCQGATDCVPACMAAGGTASSCASGSSCLPNGADGGLGCIPPSYWTGTGAALSESGTIANAAELIAVNLPYNDSLLLTGFGISIPDGAFITGIQFRVRHASLFSSIADASVRIDKQEGSPFGPDHRSAAAWPQPGGPNLTSLDALPYATYGSAYDTWGTGWAPADVRAEGFGIAIAPKYTGMFDGNDRAYIDSVRVAVFYRTACE